MMVQGREGRGGVGGGGVGAASSPADPNPKSAQDRISLQYKQQKIVSVFLSPINVHFIV